MQVSLQTGSGGLSGHQIRVAVSLSLATLAVRYCQALPELPQTGRTVVFGITGTVDTESRIRAIHRIEITVKTGHCHNSGSVLRL